MPFQNRHKLLLLALCPVVILFAASNGTAMSIFSKKPKQEVVVCSPMEGQLTFQGKPASGAKIVRWFAWKDQEGESKIYYADENGYFSLPIETDMRKPSILSQFVAKQLVTVTYGGRDYDIWYNSKMTDSIDGEYGGPPSNLRCELTREPEIRNGESILLETSCEWDI